MYPITFLGNGLFDFSSYRLGNVVVGSQVRPAVCSLATFHVVVSRGCRRRDGHWLGTSAALHFPEIVISTFETRFELFFDAGHPL